MIVLDVVVSIGQQHHGLHSNEDEDPISEGEAVSRIREAALIRDPPRPRNPVMTGALGSEVSLIACSLHIKRCLSLLKNRFLISPKVAPIPVHLASPGGEGVAGR